MMKSHRSHRVCTLRHGSVCLAVVVGALTAGCGASGVTPTPPQGTPAPMSGTPYQSTPVPSTSAACPSTTTPSTPPPGGVGIYSRQTPPGIPGASSVLHLCADGTYALDVGVTGRWVYSNGRITFMETSSTACAGIPGTYNWSLAGTRVSLTAVSDPCGIRRQDFPAASWARSP